MWMVLLPGPIGSKMNTNELKLLIKEIVEKASEIKNKHTNQINAPVNYACIFSQNKEEYEHLKKITQEIGEVIKET